MKKLIRNHRLRNSFQLFFMILFISIVIIFKDSFIEAFNHSITKSPTFITYVFFGSMLIGVIILLYTSISEIIKSKSKIKEDYKQILNNRINFHLKQISEIEKEIEKIK